MLVINAPAVRGIPPREHSTRIASRWTAEVDKRIGLFAAMNWNIGSEPAPIDGDVINALAIDEDLFDIVSWVDNRTCGNYDVRILAFF